MRSFSLALTVLLACAIAVAAAPAAPQAGQNPPQAPPKAPPPKAVSVTGKWAMTLEMSLGTGTPTLNLTQDGEKIAGTYTGNYGTFDLTGTLKDRAIHFGFTMSAMGTDVYLDFAGEVAADGQTMKGSANLGEELGDATWTAKRVKQP
jgi:hypothetical protein